MAATRRSSSVPLALPNGRDEEAHRLVQELRNLLALGLALEQVVHSNIGISFNRLVDIEALRKRNCVLGITRARRDETAWLDAKGAIQ